MDTHARALLSHSLLMSCRRWLSRRWVAQSRQQRIACPVCRKPLDHNPDETPPSDPAGPSGSGSASRPPCSASNTATDDTTDGAEVDPALARAYNGQYRGWRDARYRVRGYTMQDAARDEMVG
jgi:hypothetical protein